MRRAGWKPALRKESRPTPENEGWGTRKSKGKTRTLENFFERAKAPDDFNAAKLLMDFLAARKLLISMTFVRGTLAARRLSHEERASG